MFTLPRCNPLTPTHQRHYVRRNDGSPAWLVRTAFGWDAYVAGKLVAFRVTWKEAVEAAQAQIAQVLK